MEPSIRRLRDAISECDSVAVSQEFNRLIFAGAGVSEPRGISDAGLSLAVLGMVADALPASDNWHSPLSEYLFDAQERLRRALEELPC